MPDTTGDMTSPSSTGTPFSRLNASGSLSPMVIKLRLMW